MNWQPCCGLELVSESKDVYTQVSSRVFKSKGQLLLSYIPLDKEDLQCVLIVCELPSNSNSGYPIGWCSKSSQKVHQKCRRTSTRITFAQQLGNLGSKQQSCIKYTLTNQLTT